MPWSVLYFFLSPSNWIGKKKVADNTWFGSTQDITVDDDDDPNFDPTAPALEDESPYPEVRSAVANTDDPTMPSSTFRAWVVGLILAVLISGVNQFFYFRYPSVGISQVCEIFSPRRFSFPFGVPVAEPNPVKIVPLVLSFPICKAWARYLPNISFFGIPLNPGPFTIKEHVIITIMANAGDGPAYAVSVTPTWQMLSALCYVQVLQRPLGRHYCRSKRLLQSASPICL
jgi:hypothetical protein